MELVCKKSNWAPRFHLYPSKGWINDPCGCSMYNDEYHIFFQYHENPTPLGAGEWYHMKSKDLVKWEKVGVCLKPEFNYEKNGCWTGSSIEREGKHYIYYSSNLDGRIPQQQPAMAYSEDGVFYKKYNEQPLITDISPEGHQEMRDPKVFKHGDCYYMLEGSTRNGKGEVIGYRSFDGICWEYQGVFFESKKWMGSMFECPDFFSIGKKDFMIISPMNWNGHCNILLCGKADFNLFKFECEQIIDLDLGSDFYAAQSLRLRDGRIAVIGWLGSWGKPHPEDQFGWAGMLTCIRTINYDNGVVQISPIEEIDKFRYRKHEDMVVNIGKEEYTTECLKGNYKDIIFIPKVLLGQKDIRLKLSIKSKDATILQLTLDYLRDLIIIDKTMCEGGDNVKRICACKLKLKDKLRILLDASAVEIFIGGQVITERIYPLDEEMQIFMQCISEEFLKCTIISYEMRSIYENILSFM